MSLQGAKGVWRLAVNFGVYVMAVVLGFYAGCLAVTLMGTEGVTVWSAGIVFAVTFLIVTVWILKKEHAK